VIWRRDLVAARIAEQIARDTRRNMHSVEVPAIPAARASRKLGKSRRVDGPVAIALGLAAALITRRHDWRPLANAPFDPDRRSASFDTADIAHPD